MIFFRKYLSSIIMEIIIQKKHSIYKIMILEYDHIRWGKSRWSPNSNTIKKNIETLEIISLCRDKHPDLLISIHGNLIGEFTAIVLELTKYDQIRYKMNCIIAEVVWFSKCPQKDPVFIEQTVIRVLILVWPTCNCFRQNQLPFLNNEEILSCLFQYHHRCTT